MPTRNTLYPPLLLILLCGALLSSCTREADTRPLLEGRMPVRSIRALHELKVTDAEVAELLKARQAGLSDTSCIELLRIARGRNKPFAEGASVASLADARLKEETILELARLDQMGPWTGEYQLMRMGGMSEALILTLARRRAEGLPTVSGGSLARLKNAAIGDATLMELARRGISDADATAIIALRRRGTSESEILRRYARR